MVRDQNPLIRGVYLPVGRPATTADRSGRQDFTLTVSNTTNLDTNGDEELLVDGETTELRWSGDWPLSRGWQLQVSIPLVHYEGGHLDSMIDDWHRFLGLPRGDRPARPENQLEFSYWRADSARVDIGESHTGIGDSAIEIGYTALATDRSTLNLWLGVELPTGERSALSGNGSRGCGRVVERRPTIGGTLAVGRDTWNRPAGFGRAAAARIARGDSIW